MIERKELHELHLEKSLPVFTEGYPSIERHAAQQGVYAEQCDQDSGDSIQEELHVRLDANDEVTEGQHGRHGSEAEDKHGKHAVDEAPACR